VGVVEKDRIIDGRAIAPGDVVLGLASSGAHSNGYSLIRRIIGEEPLSSDIADSLMEPTRIYVKPVLKLLAAFPVKGLAHITGGGLVGNVPRILPPGTKAVIKRRRGRARRSSSGCRKRATSPRTRCSASSTAASAW
jgi:phosphoribosylformylglycinamidine cyclo-ligase